MAFLYDTLLLEFGKRQISQVTIPAHITDNLKHTQRPYQVEAFQRFILCHSENFEGKPRNPLHLLYNMATGSGKTLIMAGLILHLYQKGYRNFLFFVNSNNIIQKTKENFLNSSALKYLFSEKIVIEGAEVLIKEVDNFDEADEQNINIKFVSIQMLTSGLLLNVKENGLSFEDFIDQKLVLIGDEAHHNNAEIWGDLVERIHKMNLDNILLEFTATMDFGSKKIVDKYQEKVIYKYDLAQFRIDKYSKEINLIRSLYNEEERVIQALILNLYRQEVATKYGINLKPVILFKAKRTIAESQKNKENFHRLIDAFSTEAFEKIKKSSTIPIVKRAFDFFKENQITSTEAVKRIRHNFRIENCLSANSDTDTERNQILLNTLEDENNPIRAVFAVQKLNEGWDVLNLFDIVRMYEDRDGKDGKPGKTTLSEAQLIGRGARYFPFAVEQGQDKYTRKYDSEISSHLKVLEELYYHTKEDSRYVSELKRALIESGIYEDDDNFVTKDLTLKTDFKKTEFYFNGRIFFNRKIEKSYNNVKSFKDFGLNKVNYRHSLSSGVGRVSNALSFELEMTTSDYEAVVSTDVKIADIPKNVIYGGLERNPFYYFSSLKRFFPDIRSLYQFIESSDYLGGLSITYTATRQRLRELSHLDYIQGVTGLLQQIESEIKDNSSEFEGSHFISDYIHNVFKDKKIRLRKGDERESGQEQFLANEPWYAYTANYGTSEEKKFVELFARKFNLFKRTFDAIYLLRNEREVKLFDKCGRAFEPDFVLFCKQKAAEEVAFQVFIEPKGRHLISHDKWKEDFLKEIRANRQVININSDTYLITAVPFYTYDSENEFELQLDDVLST